MNNSFKSQFLEPSYRSLNFPKWGRDQKSLFNDLVRLRQEEGMLFNNGSENNNSFIESLSNKPRSSFCYSSTNPIPSIIPPSSSGSSSSSSIFSMQGDNENFKTPKPLFDIPQIAELKPKPIFEPLPVKVDSYASSAALPRLPPFKSKSPNANFDIRSSVFVVKNKTNLDKIIRIINAFNNAIVDIDDGLIIVNVTSRTSISITFEFDEAKNHYTIDFDHFRGCKYEYSYHVSRIVRDIHKYIDDVSSSTIHSVLNTNTQLLNLWLDL